jgi:hypothetical protein
MCSSQPQHAPDCGKHPECDGDRMEMPIDLAHLHQKRELREHYRAAQLELGLWQEE